MEDEVTTIGSRISVMGLGRALHEEINLCSSVFERGIQLFHRVLGSLNHCRLHNENPQAMSMRYVQNFTIGRTISNNSQWKRADLTMGVRGLDEAH